MRRQLGARPAFSPSPQSWREGSAIRGGRNWAGCAERGCHHETGTAAAFGGLENTREIASGAQAAVAVAESQKSAAAPFHESREQRDCAFVGVVREIRKQAFQIGAARLLHG